MGYYTRTHDCANDFIEIARIALGDNKKEDWTQWNRYTSPMSFFKWPQFNKGFETQLKEWEKEVKNRKIQKDHYFTTELNLKNADDFRQWRDHYILNKVDYYLQSNLKYTSKLGPKQQVNRARDIFVYFQKERDYQ